MRQVNFGVAKAAMVAGALMLQACGDDSLPEQVQLPTSDGGTSAPDAGATAAIPFFSGCKEADYVDRSGTSDSRVVQVAPTGLVYAPKCMIIAPGQAVRWEGSLTAHPLAPGSPDSATAGSPGSPIKSTSTGTSVEFSFPVAGTYPYYCELHAFGAGEGMAAVVHVR